MIRKLLLSIALVFCFSSCVAQFTVKAQETPSNRPELSAELASVLDAARQGQSDALRRFVDLSDSAGGTLPLSVEDQPLFDQLNALGGHVREAETLAATALSYQKFNYDRFHELIETSLGLDSPQPELATAAEELIESARETAGDLIDMREQLFEKYGSEARMGGVKAGTRAAWSLLRIASGSPEARVSPGALKIRSDRAELSLVYGDVPMYFQMLEDDIDEQVAAAANGYTFVAGWALLLQKPVAWMVMLARDMKAAGVDAEAYPDWEVMEGPGAPIAFAHADGADDDAALVKAFFQGQLLDVDALPVPQDMEDLVADFLAAAEKLHDGIMGDASIPQRLRQALKPILMGTYQPVDPRDYFDSAFCRRLIEADYLETFIENLSPDRLEELAVYRRTLDKVEAGHDVFAMRLNDGQRLVAVARAEAAFPADAERRTNDRDTETGETIPRFDWRREGSEDTVFFSPLPARYLYAFSLAEHYPRRHAARPAGIPEATEVWHTALGRIMSYRNGDARAEGDKSLWRAAVELDTRGGRTTPMGPPGWNFPPHVLYRDDQGDPVLLATPNGVLASPDFSGMTDAAERRKAEEAWLDDAARILPTPGDLGLIWHHFFRYCSDSPLPDMPNLIGSHYGLSDTHQTVYETLERRWVGRLIGDCDDLAEFYQVITARQGKLSHVMQLPSHAAAGYAEPDGRGNYRFVVLQTGPVLQFTAATLNQVVEKAYRSFDTTGGETHLTAAAVPLLLRFADEDTRTPFVLSARIYGDREYAEAMIRVQEYWHKYVFSAAIREMEEMLETDREPGSIKELGSLYERVGQYEKSAVLRREELEAAGNDGQARISALLDIAQLHIQDKNKPAALEALYELEKFMREILDSGDEEEYFRAMSFRAYWAMLLSRLDEPEKAWGLIHHDVATAKARAGRIPEPILRTLVVMYDRMSRKRDVGDSLSVISGLASSLGWPTAMSAVGSEIEEAFSYFFKDDDAYTAIISRYALLGRYAVAKVGRPEGLALLRRDGPYPDGPKTQTERGEGVAEEDWEWFRIVPRVYLTYGGEMMDPDEEPELYDLEGAKAMLELIPRAVAKGTGLGSDIAGSEDLIKGELMLSFVNNDLDAFKQAMSVVRSRNYASLYDDAAVVFGSNCGLVPPAEFAAWIEAFHTFFPGSQHYFKVVYRAIDKENFAHAVMLARATAGFFPEDKLLVEEADYVEALVPELRERVEKRKAEQEAEKPAA